MFGKFRPVQDLFVGAIDSQGIQEQFSGVWARIDRGDSPRESLDTFVECLTTPTAMARGVHAVLNIRLLRILHAANSYSDASGYSPEVLARLVVNALMPKIHALDTDMSPDVYEKFICMYIRNGGHGSIKDLDSLGERGVCTLALALAFGLRRDDSLWADAEIAANDPQVRRESKKMVRRSR